MERELHVFLHIKKMLNSFFHCFLGADTAYFSKGIGPFLMHNVTCVGFESTLLECKHILRASQLHGRAAGVHCLRGESKLEVLCIAYYHGSVVYIEIAMLFWNISSYTQFQV